MRKVALYVPGIFLQEFFCVCEEGTKGKGVRSPTHTFALLLASAPTPTPRSNPKFLAPPTFICVLYIPINALVCFFFGGFVLILFTKN